MKKSLKNKSLILFLLALAVASILPASARRTRVPATGTPPVPVSGL